MKWICHKHNALCSVLRVDLDLVENPSAVPIVSELKVCRYLFCD